jgi:hypothetical protein
MRPAVEEAVRVGREGDWLVLSRNEMFTDESGRRSILSLLVELQSEGLSARTSVYLGHEEVEAPLDGFVKDLAANWPGWKEPEPGTEARAASPWSVGTTASGRYGSTSSCATYRDRAGPHAWRSRSIPVSSTKSPRIYDGSFSLSRW